MSSILNFFAQESIGQIFKRNKFSIFLFISDILIDINNCFPTFPSFQTTNLQIFPYCMSNYNLAIKNLFHLLNNSFCVWSILDVRICNTRYLCNKIGDLFVWMNVSVQQAVFMLIDNRYSCQKLLVITFNELAVNSNELEFLLSLNRSRISFNCILRICQKFLPIVQTILNDFMFLFRNLFYFYCLSCLLFNGWSWHLLFFCFNRRNNCIIFLFRSTFNTSNLLLLRTMRLYILENLLILLFLFIIINIDNLEILFLPILSMIIFHLYDFSFEFVIIFILGNVNLYQFSRLLEILQLVFLSSSQHQIIIIIKMECCWTGKRTRNPTIDYSRISIEQPKINIQPARNKEKQVPNRSHIKVDKRVETFYTPPKSNQTQIEW